jgi:hypothetical protein
MDTPQQDEKQNVKPDDHEVIIIESDDPTPILSIMGAPPLIGFIFPKFDPVYGHTFKMPKVQL